MRSDFEQSLNALIAASAGRVSIVSGDRDSETQQRLWDEAVTKYGPDEARNWVAPPGNSNHEKGLAADLGGDLEWAHAHAAEFGLYFPMDWEPWHAEILGSRDGQTDQSAGSTTPPPVTAAGSGRTDPMLRLLKMLGVDTPLGGNQQDAGQVAFDTALTRPRTQTAPQPMDELGRFMAAVRQIESGGDYAVVNSIGAAGGYQYMPGTWNGYGGYASAEQAPPELQDEKARMDMQSYFDRFGSWENVAAAWVSGPNGNWQSGEVRQYVSKVMGAYNTQRSAA